MHFDWYSDNKLILLLYRKYFWYLELSRATRAYAATINGKFVGALLAEMKGEKKCCRSWWSTAFVTVIEKLQKFAVGDGVDAYDAANKDMLAAFSKTQTPDGEIVFLAVDPDCQATGIGTALLSAFEADIHGKTIYLYTDNGCSYSFYDRRDFERSQTRDVTIDIAGKRVSIQCFLYSKTIL